MDGPRHRSKPFSWPSRPRWRPASAKHEPRSLAEQRATWRAQAARSSAATPGSRDDQQRIHQQPPRRHVATIGTGSIETAVRALAAVESRPSTWQVWHVRAEALRQVREPTSPPTDSTRWSTSSTGEILQRHSVELTAPDDGITEPAVLRRTDGASVYAVAGSALYTSTASSKLSDDSSRRGRVDGRASTDGSGRRGAARVDRQRCRTGRRTGRLGSQMATSGLRLQLAIAPAGTGKPPPWPPSPGSGPPMAGTDRARPICGRRRATPRPDRRAHRHPRQTHVVDQHGDPPDWAAADRPRTRW